jgi:hypothetical protein
VNLRLVLAVLQLPRMEDQIANSIYEFLRLFSNLNNYLYDCLWTWDGLFSMEFFFILLYIF